MTTAGGSKKSNKQDLAIAALLTAPTYAEAAKAIGVSEQTIWRWMQDDDFQTAYMNAKKKALNQSISQLQSATSDAVNALKELLKATNPPNARHQAAKTILEMAFKGYEMEEFENRLARLEKTVGEKK